MNKPIGICGAIVLAIALSSCGSLLKSDYQRPVTAIPTQWAGQTTTGQQVALQQQWWKNFNDASLNALIDKALRRNNNLAQATIKVHLAQLRAGIIDTNSTPTVKVGLNAHQTLTRRQSKAPGANASFVTTASLSYELDLWGRLAQERDAAAWEAQATELDRRHTALTLIGTTAQLYWHIASLNQQIAHANASIAYNQQLLKLTRVRYRTGAVSAQNIIEAEQSITQQTVKLSSLQQKRDEQRNALAILFNQAPENHEAERKSLTDTTLPVVPAGVPADILARRPDVQAAEWRLRKSLTDVDIERAKFYPTFSLTGDFGSSSHSLSNLLANPFSTLGIGIALPFIQWNTARLRIQVSQAEYETAVIAFREVLYKALSDVENALCARTYHLAQREQQQRAFDLAKQAEQLAKVQYYAGKTGIQKWLDQQEASRQAELALIENRYQQLNNLMKLYQALGGEA